MAIPDEYTFIKRRMRALGMDAPFDKPEYAEMADERDRQKALDELWRNTMHRAYWPV